MWMFGYCLWEGYVSIMDVEILFLSHAVWYGQLIAMMPPHPGVTAVLVSNPHTYLYVGTIVTGWHLARLPCLAASLSILAFGLYRRWAQVPQAIYGKARINFRDTLDVIATYDAPGVKAIEGCVLHIVPCATIPTTAAKVEEQPKGLV